MVEPKRSPTSGSGRDTPSRWFRMLLPGGQLGPGKIHLLRLVAETGSVSGAARTLRMSHARSVKLVAQLNALGSGPSIDTRAGGEAGGGAVLTQRARELLAHHETFKAAIWKAATPSLLAMGTALSASEQKTPSDQKSPAP